MGAASHIGRVGGLAVALGIGTAILTGQGVANATTDGENSDSGSGDGGTSATENNDTGSGGLGKIDRNLPSLSDIIGRHRADETTPNSVTVGSIVKRLSDATKQVTDALESAAGGKTSTATTSGDNVAVSRTQRTGGSSLADRLATRATTHTPAPDETATVETEVQGNKIGRAHV